MKKQGHYMFDIQKVGNWVRKIFTKETSIKYYITHYLIEPAMAVITVNAEDKKTVALFKDDNNGIDNLITRMEETV